MKTPTRQRQLRGLVLHHRRHPETHPKRLVNRTARWKEPPDNGICRWCCERTAHIKTRWHPYCLNAYRVASGQHPEEIQHTLCEICGDPAEEMDHRLSINVPPVPGSAAIRATALHPRRSRAGSFVTDERTLRPGRMPTRPLKSIPSFCRERSPSLQRSRGNGHLSHAAGYRYSAFSNPTPERKGRISGTEEQTIEFILR